MACLGRSWRDNQRQGLRANLCSEGKALKIDCKA